MSGASIFACLVISVFVGLVCSMDGEPSQRFDLGIKVGFTMFIVTIVLVALCVRP